MACAAINSGCKFYAGSAVTPQNELTAYMATHMTLAAECLSRQKAKLRESAWLWARQLPE
jgi:hypothetical protein